MAQAQEQLDELVAIVDALADRLDASQRHPSSVSTAMTSQPTAAAPPPGSARELVKAMRVNATRLAPAEVQRRVSSLRRIAEQLRAASR